VAADVDQAAAVGRGRSHESRLLGLARDQGESVFTKLSGAYRAELQAHCSRIVRSLVSPEL